MTVTSAKLSSMDVRAGDARQTADGGVAQPVAPVATACITNERAAPTPGSAPVVPNPLAAAFEAPEKASIDTTGISPAAGKVLERAALTFTQSARGWHVASVEKHSGELGVAPVGPLRVSATLLDSGVVRLRLGNGVADPQVVEFDPKARTLSRLGAAAAVTEQVIISYSATELLTLYDAVKRGDPGAPALGTFHRVDGRTMPALNRLFGPVDSSVLESLPYVRLAESNGLGAGWYGRTILDRAFVYPVADAQTIANELSSVAWRRLMVQAFDRVTPFYARNNPDRHRRFLDEALRGNWFACASNSAFAHIHSNIQAEELVSDAASIGVDTSDLYRILAFHEDTSIMHGYYGTVLFARELVASINGARQEGKLDPVALLDLLDKGSEADIAKGLALTPSELERVRAAYQDAGSAIVSHYAAELARRYPRRRSPGPRG